MMTEDAPQKLPDDRQIRWQPVTSAPYDADLELAVINGTGTHAVVFPCRRGVYGWINAASGTSVELHPSHWREWDDGVPPLAVHYGP